MFEGGGGIGIPGAGGTGGALPTIGGAGMGADYYLTI